MYAKFIADMLNYRGVMIKRDLAEFIVDGTTFIKYKNEIERKQEYLDIFKIIKRELGLQVRNTNFSNLSDNNFAISAFLGCGTAERYLDLLFNGEARDSLRKDVQSLRSNL